MKPGDRVQISATAEKPPVRMYSYKDAGLSERLITIPAGTVLYHVSERHKLTAFAPVVTCFSLERPTLTGYVYILIPRVDIPAREMDDLEVRIDLAVVANAVDIYYAGRREKDFRRFCVDKFGRTVYVPCRCRFATSFRHLAVEIEEAEKRINWRYYDNPLYRWEERR